MLLAAIEQRLGVAERLADCIEDPRASEREDPRASERVRHGLAEMVRYRALLIARGYPDGTCSTNDTDRVHGAQQLSLFNAHYDSRCFHRGVERVPQTGLETAIEPGQVEHVLAISS